MAERRTRRSGSYRTYGGYSSYNYGSTARAYTPRITEKNKTPEVPETIKIDEYGTAHRIALISVMLLLAVLAITFLCLYGYNYKLSTEIASLQSELNELKEDNYYLESEFDNNLNLDYIEEVALTRLGMQKPSSYQIKYINVPKQSYTVIYNTDESADSFFSHLKDLDFKSAFQVLLGY